MLYGIVLKSYSFRITPQLPHSCRHGQEEMGLDYNQKALLDVVEAID